MGERRRWPQVWMLIAFAIASCQQAAWRVQPPPWSAASVAEAEYARVQERDGGEIVLRTPAIGANASGAFLSGQLVDEHKSGEHMVNVPLADVTRLETRGPDSMSVSLIVVCCVIVVLGVLSASGVSLTLAI